MILCSSALGYPVMLCTSSTFLHIVRREFFRERERDFTCKAQREPNTTEQNAQLLSQQALRRNALAGMAENIHGLIAACFRRCEAVRRRLGKSNIARPCQDNRIAKVSI